MSETNIETPKPGQVPVSTLPLSSIRPTRANDKVYAPVNPDDPSIIAMAETMRLHGVLEPLVVTKDRLLMSGHRRYAAARLAGLVEVPCRIEDFAADDDPDKFLRRLTTYNMQREKSREEKLREAVIQMAPDEAYLALLEHRRKRAQVAVDSMTIHGTKTRCAISKAKQPFLEAVKAVLVDRREFWPLSDRAVHYALLNNAPLRHASKPDSIYANDKPSYKDLTDLLTRARISGEICMESIGDETRPVVQWDTHMETGSFITEELDEMFKGYARDLMQSQPNHLEIIGEKITVQSALQPIAGDFCIPLTVGRGYCSLPPRYQIAKRFRASGKDKLVLIIVSDFDPDGEEIAHSFARSMRDDFEIKSVHAIKAALTAKQVADHKLPPLMKAKESSSNHAKFKEANGDNAYELEALPPKVLQTILRQTIESVIDMEAFNRELDAERTDAQYLAGVRTRVRDALPQNLN